MDLTVINGLGPARREKLAEAGIDSVQALAEANPETLAETVEINQSVLEGFREQASELAALSNLEDVKEGQLDALVGAGIRSPRDLAGADVDETASATDIDVAQLETWQAIVDDETLGEKALEIAEGAREAGEIAREGLDRARVVLEEGVNDAKVKFEEDVLSEARILPLKAKEDADERLEKIRGDVVLLREKADTALVRVGDQVAEGLPIFKAKMDEASRSMQEGAEEVRVRVQEVRDKRVLPEAKKITDKIKGLFGRD